MTGTAIAVETADGVMTVTLDRPERLNAFTAEMADDLCAALDRADADDDVRAVIVTGRGRAFCAGADLGAGASTFDYERRAAGSTARFMRDGGGVVALRIFESRKPVIAAINGPAVGVGITMTLPMDVRLASTAARLGFVFTRRGIVPEACSTWFLPRLVGVARAAEWMYTGRILSAEEALRGGLVQSVHEPDDLLPAARALAAEIAANTSGVSVTLTRQMLWRGLTFDHPVRSHLAETRAIQSRGASADAQEGIAAFLEKRPAHFPLRVSTDLPDVFGA